MAISSTILSKPNYSAIFREYVFRSANYILEKIQKTSDQFPTDQRELALHTLNYTFKMPETWPLTRKLLLLIAPKMEQAGYREQWNTYLERGIQLSQQLGDQQTEAQLRFYLGELYQYQAKYNQASIHLKASAAYFEQVGDKADQARALNRLAGVIRRQGKLKEAMRLAERGLALSTENKAEQGFSYLVLGAIAFDKQDWQEAHSILENSLYLWRETNNKRLIAWGLSNLGIALAGVQKYKEAITYYKKAIKLFQKIEDPLHEAITTMNQGNAYLKLERFSDALASYLEAEAIFHELQDPFHLGIVNNNKGMVYQKLKKLHQAERAYILSTKQLQDIGNISFLVNTMDNLGLLYIELSMYNKAASTFQEALTWLAHIKREPNYEHLFSMISTNLHRAQRNT